MAMIRCNQKNCIAIFIVTIVCLLFLFTIAGTLSAQEMSLFSFGKGKIQVRLYTDYFCGPCRNLEPKIEDSIINLVKNNIATIIFIDTPFHKNTTLYAQYFLYILNDNKTIGNALKARNALFEASRIPIEDREKLETFLQVKSLKFKTFDTKPVFGTLQGYIRDDRITSTPSCVIMNGNKKDVFSGDENILKALENLNQTSRRGDDGTSRNKRKRNP